MPDQRFPARGSWASSDRPIPRLIVRPLREFLATEAAGGLVLLAATVVALLWANFPWTASYATFWRTELGIHLGRYAFSEDLRHWVNNGAMALFFFVVGLEIKRELVSGEMSDPRRAALPVVAAAGGMAVPALLYAALVAGGDGGRGWGIPMATDIAFALGALAVVASSAPSSLKIFLLTLAIVDDIGSIAVIALFYSQGLNLGALAAAAVLVAVVVVMRFLRVWWIPAYAAVGAAFWFAILLSGIHATIAGVVLGLMTPAHALDPGAFRRLGHERGAALEVDPRRAQATQRRLHDSMPVSERLEHLLHPWTSYVVIPVFALANAGVVVDASLLETTLASPVGRGILVARVAGKLIGITGVAWLATRIGLASLPDGVTWRMLSGAAALAAVGYTVPLFVTGLAFRTAPALDDMATVALLVASVVAAGLGAVILRPWWGRRPAGRTHVQSADV